MSDLVSQQAGKPTYLKTHELVVAYQHEDWWLLEPWEVSKLFVTAFPGNLRTAAYRSHFFDDIRANLPFGSEYLLVDIEIVWTFTPNPSQVRVKIAGDVIPSGPVPRIASYTFEPLALTQVV